MKTIKKILTFLIIFVSLVGTITYFYYSNPNIITKIKQSLSALSQEIVPKYDKKHADPNYVCPMHPQIVRGKPGNCPICGMKLVKKAVPKPVEKQETALEHAKKHADPNYVCPMHPQIVRDKPGHCPICGMELVKKEAPKTSGSSEKATEKKEKKILYWVAPMDPTFRRDKPGKSPMGMDLVPVYEEDNQANSDDEGEYPTVAVKHNIAQSMGVRTTVAKKEVLSRNIRTVGFISYNEDKRQHVHVRAEGWVESITASSEGEYIKKGSVLFKYYSPDLVAAQEDYLLALKGSSLYSEKGRDSLIESAKLKMRLKGVPESIIKKITQTRKSIKQIPVYASTSGTITKLDVRKGMYVVPSTILYSIEDLNSVWIIVDVFEHQISWVKEGNPVTIRVEALGDKPYTGRVDYIYPELAPMTRTLRVRLVFDNPKGIFKPNMFANVNIQGSVREALVIPNEAIILAEDGKRVVKVVGENKYQPVRIRTGIKSNGKTEVLEGLQEGDKIVISSQFLLDSESNLQASFRRLSE